MTSSPKISNVLFSWIKKFRFSKPDTFFIGGSSNVGQHHEKPANTHRYVLHVGQPAVNWNEVHGSIWTFIFSQVFFCQKNKQLLHPQRDWIKYIPLFVLTPSMHSFTTLPKSDFLLGDKDEERSTFFFLGRKS